MFPHFCVKKLRGNFCLLFMILKEIMAELEQAGWKKAGEKKAEEVTELDIKDIFKLVDMDNSGTVSRTVRLRI